MGGGLEVISYFKLNTDLETVSSTSVDGVVFYKNGKNVTTYLPSKKEVTVESWGILEICTIPYRYRPIQNGQVFYPLIAQSTHNTSATYYRTNEGKIAISKQSSNSVTFSNILPTSLSWITNE